MKKKINPPKKSHRLKKKNAFSCRLFSRLLETRDIMKVGQITRLNSFACFYDPLIAVGIVCAQFQVVTDRSGCFSNIFLTSTKAAAGGERNTDSSLSVT